jgi:hypothetical protein
MGEFLNFTVLFKFIVCMLCLLFIQHIHGDTTSDYINANYIDVSGILLLIILRSIYTCMKYNRFMCLYRRKNDDASHMDIKRQTEHGNDLLLPIRLS